MTKCLTKTILSSFMSAIMGNERLIKMFDDIVAAYIVWNVLLNHYKLLRIWDIRIAVYTQMHPGAAKLQVL